MADKIIVTNKKALETLYKGNTPEVINAVNQLIEADKKKGIESLLVYIDDEEQMAGLKAPVVNEFNNEKQVKDTIDAVSDNLSPEFILLLGSPDIIPHQHLESPMKEILEKLYNKKGMSFKLKDFPCDILKIASDLPYACETPYTTDISKYMDEFGKAALIGSGHYVGRISGITGNNSPLSILKAIQTAIVSKTTKKETYRNYFAVTTVEPKTNYADLILKDLFNNTKKLAKSPPSDFSKWKKNQIKAPSHLIICHGSPNIPYWYGEKKTKEKSSYAIAISSKNINGNISPNTIAASLCCYGAQLYNPQKKLARKYINFLNTIGMKTRGKQQISLCNYYLQNNALAFCGSTYFSSDPTILHYFLTNVFEGKTTGEALFEARHQFIRKNPEHLELPFVQTALAEFILLGDPSAKPILHADDKKPVSERINLRKSRKLSVMTKTQKILEKKPSLKLKEKHKLDKRVNKQINKYIKKKRLKNIDIKSYQSNDNNTITHVVQGIKKHHKKKQLPRFTTRLITEVKGKIVSKTTLHTH